LAKAGEGNERLIYLNSMQDFGVIAGSRLMLGDRERDKAALTRTFTIGNVGCKTVFGEEGATPRPNVSIERFDEFQGNLLRNYSLYREAVRKSQTIAARQ
jgi:hypothetical protein